MRLHSVKKTGSIIGAGLTKVYELIGEGRLEALKIGRSTRVTDRSIDAYISSLPIADIRVRPRHRDHAIPGVAAEVLPATPPDAPPARVAEHGESYRVVARTEPPRRRKSRPAQDPAARPPSAA